MDNVIYLWLQHNTGWGAFGVKHEKARYTPDAIALNLIFVTVFVSVNLAYFVFEWGGDFVFV